MNAIRNGFGSVDTNVCVAEATDDWPTGIGFRFIDTGSADAGLASPPTRAVGLLVVIEVMLIGRQPSLVTFTVKVEICPTV